MLFVVLQHFLAISSCIVWGSAEMQKKKLLSKRLYI